MPSASSTLFLSPLLATQSAKVGRVLSLASINVSLLPIDHIMATSDNVQPKPAERCCITVRLICCLQPGLSMNLSRRCAIKKLMIAPTLAKDVVWYCSAQVETALDRLGRSFQFCCCCFCFSSLFVEFWKVSVIEIQQSERVFLGERQRLDFRLFGKQF